MTIERYRLIDRSGNAGDYLFNTLAEAREANDGEQAIEALIFEFSDSELVETPDGGDVWPPQDDDDEPTDDTEERMTLHRGMYDHETRGRHMIYAVAADKQSNVSLVETGSDRAADLRRARAVAVEAGIEDQIDWTDVQDDN